MDIEAREPSFEDTQAGTMPKLHAIQQRLPILQGWADTWPHTLRLSIVHSQQDLRHHYPWKLNISATTLSAPCSTHVTPLASQSVEPRSHACIIAARESGEMNFYLVEQWINHMGIFQTQYDHQWFWAAKKVDNVPLYSSILLYKINNSQVNHLHNLVLLNIVGTHLTGPH